MTDASEIFEKKRKMREEEKVKKILILTQLSKNMSIIKNFDVDTDQIKNFSNIEEIDTYLLERMKQKWIESVGTLEKHEQKRQRQISDFDRDLKEKFNQKQFESKYKWVNIDDNDKWFQNKLKENIVTKILAGKDENKDTDNKYLRPNPKKLLRSGSVLNTYIEKTFEQFKDAMLQNPPATQKRQREQSVGYVMGIKKAKRKSQSQISQSDLANLEPQPKSMRNLIIFRACVGSGYREYPYWVILLEW